jgi:hypothetical protein
VAALERDLEELGDLDELGERVEAIVEAALADLDLALEGHLDLDGGDDGDDDDDDDDDGE